MQHLIQDKHPLNPKRESIQAKTACQKQANHQDEAVALQQESHRSQSELYASAAATVIIHPSSLSVASSTNASQRNKHHTDPQTDLRNSNSEPSQVSNNSEALPRTSTESLTDKTDLT